MGWTSTPSCLLEVVAVPALMESFEHLTRRHAIKLASDASVEVCSLAIGEKVGHDNVVSAARMNNAVVIFLSSVSLANDLVESGVDINGVFTPVLPLSTPSKKVTLSNIPPFIKDDVLVDVLSRYGKIVSSVKKITISSNSALLKHVVSFRRFVYMILKDNAEELNLTFNVKVDNFNYVVYATTGSLSCFKCGKSGHLIRDCPQKQRVSGAESLPNENAVTPSEGNAGTNGERVGEAGPEAPSEAHSSASAETAPAEEQVETTGEVTPSPSKSNVTPSPSKTNVTPSPTDSVVNNGMCDEAAMEHEDLQFKVPNNKRRRSPVTRAAKKPAVVTGAPNCDESESEFSDNSVDYSVGLRNSGFSPREYTVSDIKAFLRKTKSRRNVQVDDFFPEVEQFQKKVTFFLSQGCFTDREGYRLKKMLPKLKSVMDEVDNSEKELI